MFLGEETIPAVTALIQLWTHESKRFQRLDFRDKWLCQHQHQQASKDNSLRAYGRSLIR